MDDRLFRFASHVVIAQSGRKLTFASDVIFQFSDCSDEGLKLVRLFLKGITRETMLQFRRDPDCNFLIDTLESLAFIVPAAQAPLPQGLPSSHFGYFEGIGLQPIIAQTQVSDAHVVIIGLGGTGTIILQNLVGAGIRRFSLIDFDKVSESNLNRQFIYRLRDQNRLKIEVAREYVLDRCPDAIVNGYVAAITSVDDILRLNLGSPVSFVVNAADHPACDVIEAAARYTELRASACLSGGCGLLDGRYGPLLSHDQVSDYLSSQREAIERAAELTGCVYPIQPVSFGPLNNLLGAMMARDIIEYLAGAIPASRNHRIWVDLRRNAIFRTPLSPSGDLHR